MRIIRSLAVAAMLILAGCGGSAASRTSPPAAPRPSSPAASPSSEGAAFCARLRAAANPQPVYLNAVIDRDNLISSFSTASPDDIERAARAEVAGWIALYCPKYAYLAKSG